MREIGLRLNVQHQPSDQVRILRNAHCFRGDPIATPQ